MNNTEPQKQFSFDLYKWIVIVALLVGSVYLNMHYAQVAWSIRTAVALVFLGAVVGLAATTRLGQKTWVFSQEARAELRKVVWPSRQETLQVTLVVVAVVILASVLLWGFDSIFLWLVRMITGQRGA